MLPTARSARFSSGLSVLDFMKRTTVARMTPAALAAIGPAAERLARAEGLEAHGLSVRARLDRLNEAGRMSGDAPARPADRDHPRRQRPAAADAARSSRSAASRSSTCSRRTASPCPPATTGRPPPGPYRLDLAIRERRLVFDVATEAGEKVGEFHLSLDARSTRS